MAEDRISPRELAALLQSNSEVAILDVRSWLEFQAGHIPGAQFVGLPRALANPAGLEVTAARVVLICLSGHRSRLPLAALRRAHPEVEFVDLAGGMLAWWAAGL